MNKKSGIASPITGTVVSPINSNDGGSKHPKTNTQKNTPTQSKNVSAHSKR